MLNSCSGTINNKEQLLLKGYKIVIIPEMPLF